jgi:hypothetical protein
MASVSYAVSSMRRALVIIVAVAWVGGCGDEQLERIESIKDEVCECKTVACGEAAMKRVTEKEIASNRKTQRVARGMMDCMKRLYDNDRPTTDPDVEAPAGSGSN